MKVSSGRIKEASMSDRKIRGGSGYIYVHKILSYVYDNNRKNLNAAKFKYPQNLFNSLPITQETIR